MVVTGRVPDGVGEWAPPFDLLEPRLPGLEAEGCFAEFVVIDVVIAIGVVRQADFLDGLAVGGAHLELVEGLSELGHLSVCVLHDRLLVFFPCIGRSAQKAVVHGAQMIWVTSSTACLDSLPHRCSKRVFCQCQVRLSSVTIEAVHKSTDAQNKTDVHARIPHI